MNFLIVKIADWYEKLIGVFAAIVLVAILIAAFAAFVQDEIEYMFFILIGGLIAWILSFGTLALFIMIYLHIKSIDNKLNKK